MRVHIHSSEAVADMSDQLPALFSVCQVCNFCGTQASYAIDECGVCGGSGDSCALVLSLQSDSLASTSAQASQPPRVSQISIDVRIAVAL